ncbi:MAG: PEP-CTERM sorting domain-containing protein [Akkermansiaceae bacterium]|jgi:hypothetical protein
MKTKTIIALAAFTVGSAHAAVLITPTGLTNTSGVSEFFPAINIINNTGLSGAADIANYNTITHGAAGAGSAWTTNAPNGAGDYFLATSPGTSAVFTLTLDQLYAVTDFVFWGYHFNAANGNEGREFTLSFSTDGGATFPTSTTISNPLSTYAVSAAATLSLGGSFNANAVQLEITDNHFEGTSPGGDRIGLGEAKFIGDAVPEPSSGLLGGLALLGLLRRRR